MAATGHSLGCRGGLSRGDGCNPASSSAAAVGEEPGPALPASASRAWKLDTSPDRGLETGASARRLGSAEVWELAVDGVADSPCGIHMLALRVHVACAMQTYSSLSYIIIYSKASMLPEDFASLRITEDTVICFWKQMGMR